MKIRNLIFNLAVATFALGFGLLAATFFSVLFSSNKTAIDYSAQTNQSNVSNMNYGKDLAWNAAMPIDSDNSSPGDMKDGDYAIEEAVKDAADKVKDAIKDTNDILTEEQRFMLYLDIQGYYHDSNQKSEDENLPSMEIWLGRYDEKLDEWIDGPPQGFVQVGGMKYAFNKFHHAQTQLLFSTEKKKGISYSFKGEYRHKKIAGRDEESGTDYDYNLEVLEGKLQTYKNGKLLKTSHIEFSWGQGC